jgi:hypothetical protein
MKVEIKLIGVEEIEAKLTRIDKSKWPSIIKNAATETAFYVRNKVRQEMPKYIDRPKPFTLNSIYVNKGSASNPEATVEWRKPSGGNSGGRYLRPEVEGGPRHVTGFEKKLIQLGAMPPGLRAVPTPAAPRDSYGNVPVSFLKKILTALQSPGTVNKRGNTKVKGIKEGHTFFASAQRSTTLRRGIYERRDSTFGDAVKRVFSFISGVNYKKTFPFYDIGRKASLDKFHAKLDEAITKALEGK